jgi:hypothetical protein
VSSPADATLWRPCCQLELYVFCHLLLSSSGLAPSLTRTGRTQTSCISQVCSRRVLQSSIKFPNQVRSFIFLHAKHQPSCIHTVKSILFHNAATTAPMRSSQGLSASEIAPTTRFPVSQFSVEANNKLCNTARPKFAALFHFIPVYKAG